MQMFPNILSTLILWYPMKNVKLCLVTAPNQYKHVYPIKNNSFTINLVWYSRQQHFSYIYNSTQNLMHFILIITNLFVFIVILLQDKFGCFHVYFI